MSLIDYSDVTGAYRSIEQSGFTAEEVNSFHIPYAQAEITGRLAVKFTAPFSSNNFTVKDLVTQLTYSRIAPLSEEERREVVNGINERIDRMLAGDELMLTTSGEVITKSAGSSKIWSNTENFPAPFSMDDPINWEVSSGEIYDERSIRDQI